MAQETLDSLVQVIFTLPLAEQEQVFVRLQDNINRAKADEWAELSAEEKEAVEAYLIQRAEAAAKRMDEGYYYTHEEAMQRINHYLANKTRVAV